MCQCPILWYVCLFPFHVSVFHSVCLCVSLVLSYRNLCVCVPSCVSVLYFVCLCPFCVSVSHVMCLCSISCVSVTLLRAWPSPILCFSVLVTSYCSLEPLWSGMGEVVPARTSPTLRPPSPPTVSVTLLCV